MPVEIVAQIDHEVAALARTPGRHGLAVGELGTVAFAGVAQGQEAHCATMSWGGNLIDARLSNFCRT
ncbi:hypothetical protein [Massilia aquatica]|uniref:Uncharacterized protein n=1 Tax=Massilia aquatica TaxID=2609000 RepID=A0ABX0MHE1_9BURK|nr:hypothetical protein [Massilia aquatica]NHZ44335.1 hypothetical protein [Massilia aquatica]